MWRFHGFFTSAGSPSAIGRISAALLEPVTAQPMLGRLRPDCQETADKAVKTAAQNAPLPFLHSVFKPAFYP